jgi:molybdate transport system substrate-binding protein
MDTPIEPIADSAIQILCAGAMHPIVDALAGELARAADRPIAARFASSGGVKARVLAGEPADVVITTAAAMDELAHDDKIVPLTATAVARSAIGVAVRAGGAKPDIASVEAFQRALRDARSIAIADPVTGSPSGNHLLGVLVRLGMTAELQDKIRWIGGGAGGVVVVGDAVVKGEAEIGLQQIAEILSVPGLDFVGPLPDELQHVTVFCAAVATGATDMAAARRVLECFASPHAAEVITAKGMAPA